MPQTQISDVIVPAQFSQYIAENSLLSTALYASGVAVHNGLMEQQLQAGAENFTIPFWSDLNDTEADIVNDNPASLSTPQKITAAAQKVRKSFVHASWSDMDLASELSGDNALQHIESRVLAYWDRQWEKRLFATLKGVLASNAAGAQDMYIDISGLSGAAANFNGSSVIDTALTLGDRLSDVKAIAMHSAIYGEALKSGDIAFFKPAENSLEIATYKGMAVTVDDNLVSATAGVYITVLFGPGAIGYAVSEPRVEVGTETIRVPAAGNGGGQTTLHSRNNVAIHPLGFSFTDASVAGISPTIAELATAANWTRVVAQRKSVPLAFLISK